MRLVEQGKLKLSDKVFGQGALLGTTYGSNAYGAREKDITVQQLLEHTAGGTTWNNKSDDGSGDPMFQETSKNHAALIGWVLDNRNPSATPGTTYSYSNFGYCVLGRIIEKVTGQTYEAWVKANVLKGAGASDMHIAGDTEAERRANEVKYYGGNVYGMKVRRMDAHGGWAGNPVDLLRFMVRVDGFNTKPDMLQAGTITTMTTGSTANSGYAKGWGVNGTTWSHGGSLPGTSTVLWRNGGGLTMALLMNTRSSDSGFNPSKVIGDIASNVTTWPNIDLF